VADRDFLSGRHDAPPAHGLASRNWLNLFVELYLVKLMPEVKLYVTFQQAGLAFLYFLSEMVSYRHGPKVVTAGQEARCCPAVTVLPHRGHPCWRLPYLSVMVTLRE